MCYPICLAIYSALLSSYPLLPLYPISALCITSVCWGPKTDSPPKKNVYVSSFSSSFRISGCSSKTIYMISAIQIGMPERTRVQTAGYPNKVSACTSSCINKHAPLLITHQAGAVRTIVSCVQQCIKPKPDPALVAKCAAEQKACAQKARTKYAQDTKECRAEEYRCQGHEVPVTRPPGMPEGL